LKQELAGIGPVFAPGANFKATPFTNLRVGRRAPESRADRPARPRFAAPLVEFRR